MSELPDAIGPYTILGELGRGGMGVVYRVRRADLGRDFALKLVLKSARLNASMMQRLEREAQAAARLAGHPGIVGVHDAGTHDDSVYLVMDFVEGRSLDHILRTEEPLPPAEAAQLIAEVARAVQHAHDNHVLHRDIKPANIMVTPERQPRLTDFGLARSQQADHDVSRLTQSDEILGTPAYMPPEQACGEALDARADVYSLGATLYELLAGVPPFSGDTLVRVLTNVLNEPPRPLAEAAPHTPVPLQLIVAQCLAKQPGERYASAQALADDLERFGRGDAVEAKAPPRVAGPLRAFVLAIVIFGAGAVALGLALLGDRSATDAPARAGGTTEAEAERKVAERRTRIATAWREMSRRCDEPFNALLRASFGTPMTSDARAAERDRILHAADAVARANPDARSPQAWRAMARHLAGDAEALTALRTLAAEPSDDPFPKAVLALTLVVGYARIIDLPPPTLLGATLIRTDRRDTPGLQAARTAATEALEAMNAPDVWSGITEGVELRDLARGAHALAEQRPHDAIAALEEAMAAPALRTLAQFLRGLCYSLDIDHALAARDLEACSRSGWIVAAGYASLSRCVLGAKDAVGGGDPDAQFTRALDILRDAESVSGVPHQFDVNRVTVYQTWFGAQRTAGRSGRAELERCAELLRTLSAARPLLTLQYGRVLRDLASIDVSEGRDARPLLETATRVLEAAIADYTVRGKAQPVGPWRLQRERAREALGRAQSVLAQYQQGRNDPAHRVTFRRAIATLESLLRDAPVRSSIHGLLADMHSRLAVSATGEDQTAAFTASAHHAREFARRNPGAAAARITLARILASWAEAAAQGTPAPIEQLQESLRLAEEMIASHPREWNAYEIRASVNRIRAAINTDFDAALAQAAASVADAEVAVRLSGNARYPWQRLVESRQMYTAMTARTRGDVGAADDAVRTEWEALCAAHPASARDPRLVYALGQSAEFAQRHAAAIGWYRRALELVPAWTALAVRIRQLEAQPR